MATKIDKDFMQMNFPAFNIHHIMFSGTNFYLMIHPDGNIHVEIDKIFDSIVVELYRDGSKVMGLSTDSDNFIRDINAILLSKV